MTSSDCAARQLVGVDAGALADQLQVDAGGVHFFDPLGQIRGVVSVDMRLLAGKLADALGDFRRGMMGVPVDYGSHGESPSLD